MDEDEKVSPIPSKSSNESVDWGGDHPVEDAADSTSAPSDPPEEEEQPKAKRMSKPVDLRPRVPRQCPSRFPS